MSSVFMTNNVFSPAFTESVFQALSGTSGLPPDYDNVLSWTLNEKLGFDSLNSLDRTVNVNDARLVNSYCADFALNDTITFSDLSGVSLTSYSDDGTAVIAIVGDTITATTAGKVWNILLSDGTWIPCNGSLLDVSGNDNHAYNTDNVDLVATQPLGTTEGLSYSLQYGFGENEPCQNCDFSSWTGDDPDNWSSIVETANSKITEVANGARFIYDSTDNYVLQMTQDVLTEGRTYYVEWNISDVTTGQIKIFIGAATSIANINSSGSGYYTAKGGGTIYIIRQTAGSSVDLVINSLVIKEIVPRLADDSDWAATVTTEHPAGYWHNGAETELIVGATTWDGTGWGVAAAVKTADTNEILHNAATGYGKALGYADLLAVFSEDYLFCDVTTANKYFNFILYSVPPTYANSVAIHRFINKTDFVLSGGAYTFDANGFVVTAT